jgi:hypothetical protein
LAHIIIIDKTDCIRGKLSDLETAFDALHEYLDENSNVLSQQETNDIEQALGNARTVASNICAGEALSSGQSLDGCINEIQAKMPQ